VELEEPENKTDAGIYLAKETPKTSGKVLAVGPEVTEVEVGQMVLFPAWACEQIENTRGTFHFVAEDEIYGYLSA